MAEKQLQAEQERLKVGLSTTRFVLDFQRDLATAQGNELRAIVDYNKEIAALERAVLAKGVPVVDATPAPGVTWPDLR